MNLQQSMIAFMFVLFDPPQHRMPPTSLPIEIASYNVSNKPLTLIHN